MCKTTTPTVNLKDLIIKQGDYIDIKDCYEKTGIENMLGQLDE